MAFSLKDYTGIKKLGEGGMGIVYRATQISLNRQIVIKAISPDLLVDATQIKMFEDEAKVAGSLDHENIIRIYDFGEDGGYFYIAMEYIEGLNLEQLLCSEPYSKEIVLLILLQALKGLHLAHQQGIIHCDIKPNNILIAKTGRVKVADFGMARSTSQVANLTTSGKNFITPEYISPEQAQYIEEQDSQRDINKETTLIPVVYPIPFEKVALEERDIRRDMWSVGVLLYRVLYGGFPFAGNNNNRILHSIIHDHPRDISQHIPALPDDLSKNIMACLAKASKERLSTLEPIIDSLQNLFFEIGIRDPEKYIKKYVTDKLSAEKELETLLLNYHIRKGNEYRSREEERKAVAHFEEAKKLGYQHSPSPAVQDFQDAQVFLQAPETQKSDLKDTTVLRDTKMRQAVMDPQKTHDSHDDQGIREAPDHFEDKKPGDTKILSDTKKLQLEKKAPVLQEARSIQDVQETPVAHIAPDLQETKILRAIKKSQAAKEIVTPDFEDSQAPQAIPDLQDDQRLPDPPSIQEDALDFPNTQDFFATPVTPQTTDYAESAPAHDPKAYGILLLPESEQSGLASLKKNVLTVFDIVMAVLVVISFGIIIVNFLNQEIVPDLNEPGPFFEASLPAPPAKAPPRSEEKPIVSPSADIDSLVKAYNRTPRETAQIPAARTADSRVIATAKKVEKNFSPAKSNRLADQPSSGRAASSSEGILKITIHPSFSLVYVDDEVVSLAALAAGKPIKAGVHSVFAQAAGYQTYKDVITIEKNATRFLPITLKQIEKNNGFLHIYSYPWSEIYIDGTFQGTTPTPKPIPLLEGEHTLVLKREGFQQHSESVRISAGEVTRIQAQLEKQSSSTDASGGGS